MQLDMEKPVKGEILTDLDNETYHNHKALSSSQLKMAYRNIELFKKRVLDKHGGFKASAAMQMGTNFHELILEPELFDPVVYPASKIDKRTKAYKAFLSENGGISSDDIITQDDLSKLQIMQTNLESHPECPDFSKTTNESSVFYNWKGFDLRVRPDALDYENKVIFDLKTTSGGISKSEFFHHSNKYDYDLSAAMYIQAMAAQTGEPWSFCFVVAQTVEPYSSALYWLGQSLFFQGFSKFRKALKNIKRAEHLGSYKFQNRSEIMETSWPVEKFDSIDYYKSIKHLNHGAGNDSI